jgi:hypothetical protein
MQFGWPMTADCIVIRPRRQVNNLYPARGLSLKLA